MQKPDDKHKHGGTYGANGKYMYRAYSEGSDVNARGFPVVPKDRSFQKFPGSNEIYAVRRKHKYRPELEALFVPCYCVRCRDDNPASCQYRHITHLPLLGGSSKQ